MSLSLKLDKCCIIEVLHQTSGSYFKIRYIIVANVRYFDVFLPKDRYVRYCAVFERLHERKVEFMRDIFKMLTNIGPRAVI